MVHNKERYNQALEFRKRGFTYSEIAKIVGVSKSTVSLWCATKQFSKRVKEENVRKAARDNTKRMVLLNKARKSERTARYAEAVRSAETEYKHYRHSPLFIAGIMLYVSEGDTVHPHLVRLAGPRMDLHKIFFRFLGEFLGVERGQIKFWLLLYPDLEESRCVRDWSKKLGLAPNQWYKNQVIIGRSTKRTLHNGVGNTIIGNTVLKKKLMRWIELASKELQN